MNLLGVGPQVALQFGTAETLKKYFKKKYTKENEDLPIKFIYLSGLIAGVPSAMVVVRSVFYLDSFRSCKVQSCSKKRRKDDRFILNE